MSRKWLERENSAKGHGDANTFMLNWLKKSHAIIPLGRQRDLAGDDVGN